MPELTRLTTEYIVYEDRIRLSGATAEGDTLVLWLTRRLLDRMLPQLVGWLEGQGQPQTASSGPRAGGGLPNELVNTFAQQAARSQAKPQAPVRPNAASHAWLVHTLDLQRGPKAIRLVFKHPGGADVSPATLSLPAGAVRQWLNVLHDQYRRAGWPMDVWPAWVTEAVGKRRSNAGVVH